MGNSRAIWMRLKKGRERPLVWDAMSLVVVTVVVVVVVVVVREGRGRVGALIKGRWGVRGKW